MNQPAFRIPAHRSAADRVCHDPQQPRTRTDLLTDAARLAVHLPVAQNGSHIAIVCRDRYHFAAALLAVWAAGHAAALPSNGRPETVASLLRQPEILGLLHDGGSDDAPAQLGWDLRDWLHAPAEPLPPLELAANRRVATVYTSGTTGDPLPCAKTAAQLLGEVATHVAELGWQPGQAFAATVPPNHLYGLLFSVLAPLLCGGSLARTTPLHAETLAAELAQTPGAVLVSVPAHLATLEVLDPGALATLTRIITSTAPLPERVWTMLNERHGLVPIEVFGSSETGGIARRQRTQGAETPWQVLHGLHIEADSEGQLWVQSPFVDPQLPQPLRTGDLVDLVAPGRFVHHGRSDGVVKTAGLRVSLQAIEDKLLLIHGVRDAAVVAIAAPQRLRDTELTAIVVAPGLTAKELRTALAAWFEPSALPRRFHFVDALPRAATGKLARPQLLQWLEQRAMPRVLQVLERAVLAQDAQGQATAARYELRVPANFYYFLGHFPGLPIVPGVAELQCAVIPAVAELRPTWRSLRRVSKLKFRHVIHPNERLTLNLQLSDYTVDFELIRHGLPCASGRMHWEAN